ncbi:MAG: hypothetical protein ACE366_06265 [Bradymonadia bacterium]
MHHFTLLTTRTCLIALLASLTLTGCPTGDDGPAPEDQADMSGETGGAEAPSENPDGRAPADGLDEAPAQSEVDVLDPEGISADDLTRPGPEEESPEEESPDVEADPEEGPQASETPERDPQAGTPREEVDPLACDQACADEAQAYYTDCIGWGFSEEVCSARAGSMARQCIVDQCRDDEEVEETPEEADYEACMDRCTDRGGSARQCHEICTEPLEREMADPREDEEDGPTCAETCEAEALEVYEACMDRHDDEQGCRDRARRTQQRCVAEECTERVIIAE